MKRIFGAVVGLGIVIGLGYILLGSSTIEVTNEPQTLATSTSATVEEEVELDVIDSATIELERINQELDAEEQKLLQEIEERKARLERIRETRSSF
jgi:alpha-L-fucosidase